MARMSNGKANGDPNAEDRPSAKDFWSHCETFSYFLMVFFVVLTFWVGAKFFSEIGDLSRPDLSRPTISVSGKGSVFVRPDVGVVSFSSVAESKDAGEAQRKSALIVNQAIKFLKESGVEDKDIKTTSYNIWPLYDFPERRREFAGFQVRQSMELKIRDSEDIGSILSGLASLGITEVGSLVFEVDKPEEAERQAREEAITDARKKAAVLAASLGIRLGKIVAFNESGFVPIFQPVSARTFGFEDAAAVVPEVPVGENEISSNVSVTFEIK